MISITELAIDTILDVLANDKDCEGKSLRVAVRGGGCSGYQYCLDFDNPDDDDVVIRFGNLDVCIDTHSAALLGETQIDYIDEPFQKGFVFNNPSPTSKKCGCGKSFLP